MLDRKRTMIVGAVLVAVLGAIPFDDALAGSTDQVKIGKIVRKYASDGELEVVDYGCQDFDIIGK